MSKKQNRYNTRRDILSYNFYDKQEMVRLHVENHIIKLSHKPYVKRGYWIKKGTDSIEFFNNKKNLFRIFKDNQIVIDDFELLKQHLLD